MTKKENQKALCMKLSPEDHHALEQCAAMTGGTMAGAVRGLIRTYLIPQLRAKAVFPGWDGTPADLATQAARNSARISAETKNTHEGNTKDTA